MADQPLPLDEFCWPPNNSTSAGPIQYADDGSIIVGSNYGDTDFQVDVEGDDFTFEQNTYNDTIVQNFEIVREALNNTINFHNDNSTTIGPVTSFFDVTENINTNVTNMGDIAMGDVHLGDVDMRDFSRTTTVEGGSPGSYNEPQLGVGIALALTKSPISAASSNVEFVPGSGVASLLYRRPPPTSPLSAPANAEFARRCRFCQGKEMTWGRGDRLVIECWEWANLANPYGSGNTIGASASSYADPQRSSNVSFPWGPGGSNQVQNIAMQGVQNPGGVPLLGIQQGSALQEAMNDDPEVVARQRIVLLFNISPCTIEANKVVLVSRETEHRYWIVAEACDVCPP